MIRTELESELQQIANIVEIKRKSKCNKVFARKTKRFKKIKGYA